MVEQAAESLDVPQTPRRKFLQTALEAGVSLSTNPKSFYPNGGSISSKEWLGIVQRAGKAADSEDPVFDVEVRRFYQCIFDRCPPEIRQDFVIKDLLGPKEVKEKGPYDRRRKPPEPRLNIRTLYPADFR